MMNLFLDSNIWLDLYHFSHDDLQQFGKLSDMISKDVKLFVTKQVIDEVGRNRDMKIKDAYTQFKKLSLDIPNLCKGYPQYQTLKELLKNVKRVHGELCDAINIDIEKEDLHADKTIRRLFGQGTLLSVDTKLVDRAKARYDVGNPPGKRESYGDAINWEALLAGVPKGEDLFFVSSDKDFRSPLNDNQINTFLSNEWKVLRKSEVHFYQNLTTFLDKHLVDIELRSENEKNGLIRTLSNSGSFSVTHSLLAQLSTFENFTDDQLEKLLDAAAENGQVGHILKDPDVYGFYRKYLLGRTEKFLGNEKYVYALRKLELFANEDPGAAEDAPF